MTMATHYQERDFDAPAAYPENEPFWAAAM
jgi:hypothetical protein